MTDSIYNELIAAFENEVSEEEYAEAFRIYDLRCGASRGREWKASVFFVIILGSLFFMMTVGFDIRQILTPGVLLLIGGYLCIHYLFLLPAKAKKRGRMIYQSSALLSETKKFRISRDCLSYKNKWEYLKRYNSELTDCIETEELFVLIGGLENRLIVIRKKGLQEQTVEKLSEHFARELSGKYRRKR